MADSTFTPGQLVWIIPAKRRGQVSDYNAEDDTYEVYILNNERDFEGNTFDCFRADELEPDF